MEKQFEQEEEYITTELSTNAKAGSCNGCSRYITEDKVIPHCVYVINLNSSNIRLCPMCAEALIRQLK
jgi:endonuclease IV